MKKLIIVSLFFFFFISGSKAQTWNPISGRYSYTFLKIDSLIYLPNGPTSTRPTPVLHSYWLRFNSDSVGFEYSDGVKWSLFARKVPDDWSVLTNDPSISRDTTVVLPCSTFHIPYVQFHLPQFTGFRIRLSQYGQLVPTDPAFTCIYGNFYYVWNPVTAILIMLGWDTRDGTAIYPQVTAY